MAPKPTSIPPTIPVPFRPFVEDPAHSVVVTDFDGTLADIVDDPAAAHPRAGTAAALAELARRYAAVAVVSGRPLAFLEGFGFDPAVTLVGIYGLERSHEGQRIDHPEAGVWREVIADVLTAAQAGGPKGMRTEGKGLSVTLHFREAPERARAVEKWARSQAARTGLELRSARMSFELHPPVHTDKGTAVLDLVAEAEQANAIANVCFLGDDVGDLPAFGALDQLAEQGRHCVRVVARSPEVSPDLLDRADVVLDGPPAITRLLHDLVGA